MYMEQFDVTHLFNCSQAQTLSWFLICKHHFQVFSLNFFLSKITCSLLFFLFIAGMCCVYMIYASLSICMSVWYDHQTYLIHHNLLPESQLATTFQFYCVAVSQEIVLSYYFTLPLTAEQQAYINYVFCIMLVSQLNYNNF